MINLKYIFTSALLVAAASASQAVSRQQMQKQIDKDAPAYTIQGLSLIHISEPTRLIPLSRMPSSA